MVAKQFNMSFLSAVICGVIAAIGIVSLGMVCLWLFCFVLFTLQAHPALAIVAVVCTAPIGILLCTKSKPETPE